MRRVTASATRSDGWWAVEVGELPGLYTQVQDLAQVETEVVDAALALGVSVDAVDVVVR